VKKGIIAIIAFIIIVMGSLADVNIHSIIYGDDELKVFNSPFQKVTQRFEDKVLIGSVNWDGSSGATIVTEEEILKFTIGNPAIMANGATNSERSLSQTTTLDGNDSAKSIASQSGITPSRSVVKPVNTSNMKVFAYYYYGGFPELKENAHLFSNVALRWFETDGDGNLFYEYKDNYGQVLSYLKSRGIKTHASVVLMDKEALHQLLTNPQSRARLIDQLYNQVYSNNYDGVDIDFEFIPPSDSDYYTVFLRELKQRIGSKELSAAVLGRTAKDKWPIGYNYQDIGKIVDKLIVMTYDYRYPTSQPGPVAPLWWVQDNLDYMMYNAHIPASKLFMGLATYGYDWGSTGGKATTVTLDKLNTIKNTYQVSGYFDTASMSPYYRYTGRNGIAHQIWLENEHSLNEKLKIAVNRNLGGISFWRIGNGFDDLFNLLERN